jgi:glycerate-2-kinase
MIRNFSSFNYSPTVNQAASIARAGLESVQPELLLERVVHYNGRLKQLKFAGQLYDLDDYDRIFIVGIGSGCSAAAGYFKSILQDLPLRVFVMDPAADFLPNEGIYPATRHPTANNAASTSRLLGHGPFSEEDLVIAVTDSSANNIVNAGSFMPPDQQRIILQGLADLDASDEELLTVAVHLAEGRGGDLARLLQPAVILNYIISNRLDSASQPIAASPFVQHPASLYDAKSIVEQYNILAHCNLESCVFITNEIIAPQSGVGSVLLASPLTWLEPMKLMAKEFGLAPQVFTSQDLSFRDDSQWRAAHSSSHCLLSLFPQFDPAGEIELYEDFSGTELYLTSGIFGETAGQLLDSGSGTNSITQPIVAEFPTFNVGAIGLRII